MPVFEPSARLIARAGGRRYATPLFGETRAVGRSSGSQSSPLQFERLALYAWRPVFALEQVIGTCSVADSSLP